MHHRGFLLCTDKDKERDEDQHGVAEQTENPEHNSQHLADPGGNAGRVAIGHGHDQQGSQDAAAIHGEGGDQIKEDEADVDGSKFREQFASGRGDILDIFHASLTSEHQDQKPRNNDVDQGAGDRHDQFFGRSLRDSLKPGDAPNWQQCDVGGGNTKSSRRQDMTKLMKQNARENQCCKNNAFNSARQAASGEMHRGDPREENNKRRVNANIDTENASDFDGSKHGDVVLIGQVGWIAKADI